MHAPLDPHHCGYQEDVKYTLPHLTQALWRRKLDRVKLTQTETVCGQDGQ